VPVSDAFLQKNFNVDSIEILNKLFHQAEQELGPKPAGSKITRVKTGTDFSDEEDDAHQSLVTPSSFLKIDGLPGILMLASGEHKILGTGTSARVKLAIDKHGTLYAIKIFLPPKSIIQKQQIQNIQEEHRKLHELQIAPGASFFSQKKFRVKLYSVQHYLGHPIDSFLQDNPHLNFKTRMHLAIALCIKLHQLHTGGLPQAHTPYVHFDLKPQNITIQLGKEHFISIHLVDFGSARPLVILGEDDVIPEQMGSLIYLPVDAIQMVDKGMIQERARAFQRAQGMCPCDLIGLKRILNFHRELLVYYPQACSIFREADIVLLSPAIQALLSTLEVNTTAADESALFIAAALANELCSVTEKHDLTTLKANPQLQQSLLDALAPPALSEELASEHYLGQFTHA